MKTNKNQNIKNLKQEIDKLKILYNQIKYETDLIKEGLLYQSNTFGKMLKEYNNYKKKSMYKERLINEYKITQKYVENNDQKERISEITSLTNSEITEKELIEAQINNPKNYQKINQNIENSCKEFISSKLTTNQFRSLITKLGTDIKNKIIYETYHNPEKYIPIKEIEKSDEKSSLFVKGILFKFLTKNNITTAIKKENKNENQDKKNDLISISMIQLISSGEIFKKVLTLSYDYGEDKNAEILTNKNVQSSFIKQKKKEFSHALKIKEDKITITNFRYGSIKFDLIIGSQYNEEEFNQIKKDNNIYDITYKSLLEGCILEESMFDEKGNRYNDYEWGINQKRGPPDHLEDYIPPLGYLGFGLKVYNQFDNGDNTWLGYTNVEGEWYIAYHGTGNNEVIKKIMNEGLIKGPNQAYSDSENINKLSNAIFPICGDGVYLSPDISEAQDYSQDKHGICLNGKEYYIVFMCRVNPYKVRFVKKKNIDDSKYWIVGGDSYSKGIKSSDEIRPYRILVKEMFDSLSDSNVED